MQYTHPKSFKLPETVSEKFPAYVLRDNNPSTRIVGHKILGSTLKSMGDFIEPGS